MENRMEYIAVWNSGMDNVAPDVTGSIRTALTINRCYGFDVKVKERRKGCKNWKCVAEVTGNQEITFKGNKRIYYNLPLDQYNQPSGMIEEISMTKAEYEFSKAYYGMYLMDSYIATAYRAMD